MSIYPKGDDNLPKEYERLSDIIRVMDIQQPLRQLIEEVGDVTYVGAAACGSIGSQAVWQIKRIKVDGSLTEIAWCLGDSQYNNVWDDRASLVYQ